MRIRVAHTTRYAYEAPARAILQVLRMTPRPHEGQHIVHWRIEADVDVRLTPGEDVFGNVVYTLEADKPGPAFSLEVQGEVETLDTHGVVRGAVEPLAPILFLRETPLTQAGPDIDAFARDAASGAGAARLDQLHGLMGAVYREVRFDTAATHAATTAREAFDHRHGVCQDMAQIFIAGARRLGAPARYVSGHLMRADTPVQEAAHAWAEAWVDGLGWVAFDPANGVCATDAYVRVAVGLDSLDAAPVRGTVRGGGREEMSVNLSVADAAVQAFGQSQA